MPGYREAPATDKQVRMVYALARKAGMDNDVLHARCLAVTRKEHITQLTRSECARLIDSLTGVDTSSRRQYDRPLDRDSQEQINKILGLARKLGWLEDGSRIRLNKFLRKYYGVEHLDWLPPDKASNAIEALKAMVKDGRGERKAKATN